MHVDDMRNGYIDIVEAVRDQGKIVPSRIEDTLEVRDFTFVLKNPYDALPVGVGRGVSKAVAAVEAVQLVAGISTPDLLLAIKPSFADFLDRGPFENMASGKKHYGKGFHGAYGPRTRSQLAGAYRRLSTTPDTRQAVVTIWNSSDYDSDTRHDYPCTVMQDFLIRDGKLHMSTVMRSNDVWWGTAHDIFQFSRVQLSMAAALGIEVGEYTHTAISMHIYKKHWDLIDTLKRTENPGTTLGGGFSGSHIMKMRHKKSEYVGTNVATSGTTEYTNVTLNNNTFTTTSGTISSSLEEAPTPGWDGSRQSALRVIEAAGSLLVDTSGFSENELWYVSTMRSALLKGQTEL